MIFNINDVNIDRISNIGNIGPYIGQILQG